MRGIEHLHFRPASVRRRLSLPVLLYGALHATRISQGRVESPETRLNGAFLLTFDTRDGARQPPGTPHRRARSQHVQVPRRNLPLLDYSYVELGLAARVCVSGQYYRIAPSCNSALAS